jgi:transposase
MSTANFLQRFKQLADYRRVHARQIRTFMGKQKDITPKKVAVIVAYVNDGVSYQKIANKLSVSKATVCKVIKRHRQSGSYTRRVGSGRVRKTSRRDDNVIRRAAVLNPFVTSAEIAASLPVLVSARTIRRRLLVDFKLPRRIPARKPLLNATQRKKRVQFCNKYKNWTAADWEKVLFSDESTFCQFGVRSYGVRRPPNTRYDPRYTRPTVKQPPKIMVWGCFSARGRGSLHFVPQKQTVNAARYVNILENKLETTMHIHRCTIFQQDSAPAHTARLVTDWFKNKTIQVLPWPGNSPDLNPIENLWELVKRRVAKRAPSNMTDLTYWVKRVWCTEITPEVCQKLIHSMPKRLGLVIKCRGAATKY